MGQISDLPSSPGTPISPADKLAMDRESDNKTKKVSIINLAQILTHYIIIQSRTLLTPPSHVLGNIYMLAETGTLTDAWAAKTNGGLVISSSGNWVDIPAREGLMVYDLATGATWRHNGTEWTQTIGFDLQTVSSVSGTLTMDFRLGNKFKTTLTEIVSTVTLTNPDKPTNITLEIVQDSTPRTIDWTGPGTIKWVGGSAPTLSAGSGAIDIITFYWNGTYYIGQASLNAS